MSNPIGLSIAELRQLPSHTVPVTFERASRHFTGLRPLPSEASWRESDFTTAVYRGVPLATVLERANLSPDALEVVATGADRGPVSGQPLELAFQRALPMEVALDPDALLALDVDGVPLDAKHGGPLRLIVPGRYGVDNVKWLRHLDVVRQPFKGYFQSDDYVLRDALGGARPLGPMRVNSMVSWPRGAVPQEGATLEGWAWSGSGQVSGVETSLDGGEWRPARLLEGPGPRAWLRWEAALPKLTPGKHSLRCRARDAAGNLQPERAAYNSLGYGNNAIGARPFYVR